MTIDVIVNGNSLVSNGKYLLTSDIQFSSRICFSMAEHEKKVSKIVDNIKRLFSLRF